MTALLQRPAKRARLPALVMLLAGCLSYPAATVGEEMMTEYQLKAAFLYNFSRFVSWPAPARNTFRLCVVGENPFGPLLDSLSGKTAHNSILIVEQHNSPDHINDCQLVYISDTLEPGLNSMLAGLANRPILTVSDIESFTDAGGMIEFTLSDNRIRFEINTVAAANAGLVISSKLLSLATSVKTGQ